MRKRLLKHSDARPRALRRRSRPLHAGRAASDLPDERALDDAVDKLDRVVALRTDGRYDEAETVCIEVIEVFERGFGPEHPDVANALITLGGVHDDAFHLEQAHRAYSRAMDIMRRYEQFDEPSLARLRVQAEHYLANTWRQKAHYDRARAMLHDVLARAERTLGPLDSDVASIYNSLGMLGKYSGRFEEGVHAYLRCLHIHRLSARDEARLASVYHNLGGIEHARGHFRRGLPFAREAVRLRRSVCGDAHPLVAADLGALAGLLDGIEAYEESIQLYWRAIGIYERAAGALCYELAIYYNNLAAVFAAQGRVEDAEPLYRGALDLKERHLGGRHPDVAMSLNNLALLLADTDRRDEAATMIRRALSIFEETLDADHPKIAVCRENLTYVTQPAAP